MTKLVLIRHGESQWNLENRFTGWVDVDLTEKGRAQALEAGRQLRAQGLEFDVAYTSVLKRAIRTLWLGLDTLDQMWLPVHRDWRLNERHYGALQGLNKAQTAARHGEEQVLEWRRAYAVKPPALEPGAEGDPMLEPRYRGLSRTQAPLTECLKDTVDRFLPYWNETIRPQVAAGKRVLIVAHGNSLRALRKHLEQISDEEIVGLNIPTGAPLVYELDEELNPAKHYYLGDQAAIEAAISAVANQASAS